MSEVSNAHFLMSLKVSLYSCKLPSNAEIQAAKNELHNKFYITNQVLYKTAVCFDKDLASVSLPSNFSVASVPSGCLCSHGDRYKRSNSMHFYRRSSNVDRSKNPGNQQHQAIAFSSPAFWYSSSVIAIFHGPLSHCVAYVSDPETEASQRTKDRTSSFYSALEFCNLPLPTENTFAVYERVADKTHSIIITTIMRITTLAPSTTSKDQSCKRAISLSLLIESLFSLVSRHVDRILRITISTSALSFISSHQLTILFVPGLSSLNESLARP